MFIHANDDGKWGSDTGRGSNDKERAQSVMGSLSHQFYGKFEVPVENVKQFYIYAGINAMRSALNMSLRIKEMAKNVPVTVVACSCDMDEKKRILAGSGIEIISCACGGQSYLGRLAEKMLAS